MTTGQVAVIIQARMGSSRLPGKVMIDLHGRTVLHHVVERARRAEGVDQVVVATSTKPTDDVIERETEACGAVCFRGSETDVLDRYVGAARAVGAETIVRVTSDCPLYDTAVLNDMLGRWNRRRGEGKGLDYLSNTVVRSYPRGLDTEIFTMAALETCHRDAALPAEREHVTPHIYRNPDKFRIEHVVNDVDLSAHRWTLDTDEDLRLIRAIYDALYPANPDFTTADILALLKRRPELSLLNAHVEQKKLGA